MPSWYDQGDRSTVVPRLGGPVTSFQHSWIISEHGAAPIWPHAEREQAQALIEKVADPRARESLRAAAARLGLA